MRASLAARTALDTLVSVWTEGSPETSDRRTATRHQAALTAEVLIAGSVHRALIRNISTGGLTLAFPKMPTLFRGALLLVRAPGLAPLSGLVKWMSGQECGVAFNNALAEDVLEDELALFDPGKRARPARARIKLPCVARSGNFERRVVIDNIGSGGAQISSGLKFPLSVGHGLMLEIEGLRPIGAYVRWCKQGQCGVMFSKLLPIVTAEAIADRCCIHPSWLREVRAAHSTLVNVAG